VPETGGKMRKPAAKPLTKGQAWALLETLWKVEGEGIEGRDPPSVLDSTGLCGCIWTLHCRGHLRESTFRAMLSSMRRPNCGPALTPGSSHFWTRDKEGASARAKYCAKKAKSARGRKNS